AAESASKLTALSQLSLGRRDLADRGVPLQYAVGEDAVRVETLVTMALVVAFEGRQLPCLTGNPGGYPGFDHAQVSAMQFAPIGCAQRCPLQLAEDLERVAETPELGMITGHERIDQRGGIFRVVARQAVQLRTGTGPASRPGTVIAQRAANVLVVRVRVSQQPREYVLVGAALAQFQKLTRNVIGVVRRGGRDRALGERRHVVAAPVEEVLELRHLVYGGDRALGQLRDAGVDVLLDLLPERVRGCKKRDVGTHATRVDRRIEQEQMPLLH